jgi:hypothetical protein
MKAHTATLTQRDLEARIISHLADGNVAAADTLCQLATELHMDLDLDGLRQAARSAMGRDAARQWLAQDSGARLLLSRLESYSPGLAASTSQHQHERPGPIAEALVEAAESLVNQDVGRAIYRAVATFYAQLHGSEPVHG